MSKRICVGHGCGYSNATKDYPYLYWPAPNYNIDTSSSNPGDYMAVFKYSTCVKSCPLNKTEVPVECVQPTIFDNNTFVNCVY